MKKICFALAIFMTLSATFAFAQANPLKQLTGSVWVESAKDNKVSILYGVECAVTMEYMTAQYKAEKEGKKLTHAEIVESLTAFPENWILAFTDVSREQIVDMLDSWYMENPTQIERPVFNVLWYEIMEPKFKRGNK